MKQLFYMTRPMLWSIAITSIVLVLLIGLISKLEEQASPVLQGFEDSKVLSDESMLILVPKHVSTQYLYKMELKQNKAIVELRYNTMQDLVENLNVSLEQLTTLFFHVTYNIEDVTIYVSELQMGQSLYEIKLNKDDYEAGKELQIMPLS